MTVETILGISSSLPLSSKLSFSYTCRSLRDLFRDKEVSVETIFGRQNTESSASDSEIRAEQFAFHHILERYRPREPGRSSAKAIYSYCRARHFVADFTAEELMKNAEVCQCKGASRRFWICPALVLDYHTFSRMPRDDFARIVYKDKGHEVRTTRQSIDVTRRLPKGSYHGRYLCKASIPMPVELCAVEWNKYSTF